MLLLSLVDWDFQIEVLKLDLLEFQCLFHLCQVCHQFLILVYEGLLLIVNCICLSVHNSHMSLKLLIALSEIFIVSLEPLIDLSDLFQLVDVMLNTILLLLGVFVQTGDYSLVR